MIGGGTGPAEGTRATTCTPGEWNIHRMLEAAEGLPLNFGFLGKGNASPPEPLVEQILRGRHRPQAPRGLGHDAGRHRYGPDGRRRIRRAGRDSHRHAQRVGLRRRHARGVQGSNDPHLPQRGCGRRSRARHPEGLQPAERPAVEHESDDAVHGEHAGRAPGHADGLPSSESRRCRKTSPSRSPGSGRRRWPRKTCCTILARSA